jgi:multisubunit Na+/H+ antiporter MnhB subunit
MATRDADLAAEQRLAESAARVKQRTAARSAAVTPLRAALVIGIGLIAAPFIFQMLGGENRALKGADMMDAFKPYMTEARITQFQGFLVTIDAAEVEVRTKLLPAIEPVATAPPQRQAVASVEDWSAKWRGEADAVGINEDMSGMVNDIAANLDNYAAVNALPKFFLFPFFFITPGIMIALLARAALKRARAGAGAGTPGKLLVVMGIGLIAAPFIFQMMGGENRAFEGKSMIDDFAPIMTVENITNVQGYFPVIGLAEGQLRKDLVPLAGPSAATDYPAIAKFSGQWNVMSAELADFLGAMNDNLGEYAAVKALPPFSLFPFFFILPGLMVAGFGLAALRRT